MPRSKFWSPARRERHRSRSRSREREWDRERDRPDRRGRDRYRSRSRSPRRISRSPVIRRRSRSRSPHRRRSRSDSSREKNTVNSTLPKKSDDPLLSRTGGAYIPPARLKLLQDKVTDKGSKDYQRLAWEALKKSLTGLTNKVNISNISFVVREIFKLNVIRGRGVLTRAIMQAQTMSPTFTHVYAALVAVINTKFPQVCELLLRRLLVVFKRGIKRNDKTACVSSTRFVAHLLNHSIAHEIVVLEMLTLLLENPTDDSIEISIAMLKECGKKLTDLTKNGVNAIFDRLMHILNEADVSTRTKYSTEVMFAIRKDRYKDYPTIVDELDLVLDEDKNTHLLTLEDAVDPEEILNVFQFDPEYEKKEALYQNIVKEVLGVDSESDESGSSADSDSETDNDEEKTENKGTQEILDMTETNLVALRRNIYLVIQSSLDFEECAHKLIKLELGPSQIPEMCYMVLDCCSQQRTYEKFYGLLAQRFCQLNKTYVEPFTEIFRTSYETIHRIETNKLRNVAKFFSHLLYTDAISWLVLSIIRLNEDDTTSSSRIFIKILFQELCEYMSLKKLNDRVKDVTLQEAFEGVFPRDNPHNTRFAINFFTSIGLGGLTDDLREHLKGVPKNVPVEPAPEIASEESESPSSSSDSESEEEVQRKRKKKSSKKKKQKKSAQRAKKKHSKHRKEHRKLMN